MLVRRRAQFKFESKFKPLLVLWQSLLKAIPESRRQSNGLAVKSTAQLLGPRWAPMGGSDGQARTPCASESAAVAAGTAWQQQARLNTLELRFQVGGSRCWQRPARSRKTCYQSCDTDSVRESKRFKCFVNFGQ